MINLLRFIIRYQTILLFLLLEIFSFILIFNNSNYQQTKISIGISNVKGGVYKHISAIRDYFHLKTENANLIAENTELRNKLMHYLNADTVQTSEHTDSLRKITYRYIAARIISNSTNKPQNYITLNIGSAHGVQPEMGVVSQNGIVGTIIRTSKNYSVAISVLNSGYKNVKFSGRLKRCGDYGTITWDGANSQVVQLSDIAQQIDVELGDTVVTNQHSEMFPAGIMIGTVKNIKTKDGTFLDIDVELNQNMRSLQNVYIVEFPDKEEIRNLQNNAQ